MFRVLGAGSSFCCARGGVSLECLIQNLEELMAGFFGGFLVFGLIGALIWGWAGFMVGGLIGGVITASNGKNDKKPSAEVLKPASDSQKKIVVETPKSQPLTTPVNIKAEAKALSFGANEEYANLVVSCLGLAMMADGVADEAEMDLVREIVVHDTLLYEKAKVVSMISVEIERLRVARQGSGVGFRFRLNDVSSDLRNLKSRQQVEHLEIILKSMLEHVKSRPGRDPDGVVKVLIDGLPIAAESDRTAILKSAVPDQSPVPHEDRTKLAEDYLRKAGDLGALAAFQSARREKRFGRGFINASRGSTVLRTAMGVFLGLIAADVVRAALREGSIDALSGLADEKIKDLGGLESLEGLELESFDALTKTEADFAGSGQFVELPQSNVVDESVATATLVSDNSSSSYHSRVSSESGGVGSQAGVGGLGPSEDDDVDAGDEWVDEDDDYDDD